MNKNCTDKPYLLGRIASLVSNIIEVPSDFMGQVAVSPLQKLSCHYVEACKCHSHPLYEELMDVISKYGDARIPSFLVDKDAGQAWIGYYHQSAEIQKCEERKRIGQLLANRRKELGLTTRQLAESVGFDHSNIVKIENGRYSVGIDVLSKISGAMGMRIDFTLIDEREG